MRKGLIFRGDIRPLQQTYFKFKINLLQICENTVLQQ